MTNSYNTQDNEKVPFILSLLDREGLQFVQTLITKSMNCANPMWGFGSSE